MCFLQHPFLMWHLYFVFLETVVLVELKIKNEANEKLTCIMCEPKVPLL